MSRLIKSEPMDEEEAVANATKYGMTTRYKPSARALQEKELRDLFRSTTYRGDTREAQLAQASVPDSAQAMEEMKDSGEADMNDEYVKGEKATLAAKVLNVPYPIMKPRKPWTAREQYISEVKAAKQRGYIDKDPMGMNYGEGIQLGYQAKDLEEHVENAVEDRTISIAGVRDFLVSTMPKAKPGQIEKILATNTKDAIIAYSLGTANVKNVAPGMLQGIAARGLNITDACKFGKSKKLYKSIKVPKVLFGVRAINPPSPAIFIMRFMAFIWRLMGTGINRPPGSFLRIGMAFMKNLGEGDKTVKNSKGKIMMVPFTKPMLIKSLLALDKIAPGLVGAYAAYQLDAVQINRLKKEERADAKRIRENNLREYNDAVTDIGSALDAFSGTLATAANLLLPGVGIEASRDIIDPLLVGYTEGPKKPTALKGGDYRRGIFGGYKSAKTITRPTYTKSARREKEKEVKSEAISNVGTEAK